MGIYGNVIINISNLKYFFLYYGVTVFCVLIMLQRIRILKVLLRALRSGNEDDGGRRLGCKLSLAAVANRQIAAILAETMVFFIKAPDISLMNRAILYVRDNELTFNLQFVTVMAGDGEHVDENPDVVHMAADVQLLQRIYTKMRLDYVGFSVADTHSPSGSQPMVLNGQIVKQISEALHVPPHFMFISCPSELFPSNIAKLGGVRLITHS